MRDVAVSRPSTDRARPRDRASRWGIGVIVLIVGGTAVAVVLITTHARASQRERAAVHACEMNAMTAGSQTVSASVTASMSDDASVTGEWPRYRVRGSVRVDDVGGPSRLVDYTCDVVGEEDEEAPGLAYTVRDISVTSR